MSSFKSRGSFAANAGWRFNSAGIEFVRMWRLAHEIANAAESPAKETSLSAGITTKRSLVVRSARIPAVTLGVATVITGSPRDSF